MDSVDSSPCRSGLAAPEPAQSDACREAKRRATASGARPMMLSLVAFSTSCATVHAYVRGALDWLRRWASRGLPTMRRAKNGLAPLGWSLSFAPCFPIRGRGLFLWRALISPAMVFRVRRAGTSGGLFGGVAPAVKSRASHVLGHSRVLCLGLRGISPRTPGATIRTLCNGISFIEFRKSLLRCGVLGAELDWMSEASGVLWCLPQCCQIVELGKDALPKPGLLAPGVLGRLPRFRVAPEG